MFRDPGRNAIPGFLMLSRVVPFPDSPSRPKWRTLNAKSDLEPSLQGLEKQVDQLGRSMQGSDPGET